MSQDLPLTGERTVPGIPHENYWFRRHEAAYKWAAPYVRRANVLEIGCGEGYGTDLLARRARHVIGVDYDPVTVAHAARSYPAARFVRANLAALPIATGSMDVVAALQVVEHVWDHAQFVRECARVLRPGGVLLATTPNRLTFSPGTSRPRNPFHTWEFTSAELTTLLQTGGFVVEHALGLHAGPRLGALDERYGSFVDAQLAAPAEQWPARLTADVSSVGTADFDVVPAHDLDVDAALDLIQVARPHGR